MELTYHATIDKINELATQAINEAKRRERLELQYMVKERQQQDQQNNVDTSAIASSVRVNYRYDIESVRPKLYRFELNDKNGITHLTEFFNRNDDELVNPNSIKKISSLELQLQDYGIRHEFDSPVWLRVDDIHNFNLDNFQRGGIFPYIQLNDPQFSCTIKGIVKSIYSDKGYTFNTIDGCNIQIVNLGQIDNVDELVASKAMLLPKLNFNKESTAWEHDSNFDKLLEKRLNVGIKEYGCCCIPYMNISDALNDRFHDRHASIYMPPSSVFDDRKEYYSVVMHELTHIMIDRSFPLGESRPQNEVAAELGASVLIGLFEHKEPQLDKFSTNYVIGWGIADLQRRGELNRALEACTHAVMNVREAIPEIDKCDRSGNRIVFYNPNLVAESSLHAAASDNQIGRSNEIQKRISQLRRNHLDDALAEVKYQMKQLLLESKQEQQAKAQSEGPAGKKLGAAQLEQSKANLQTQAPSGQTKAHSTPSGSRPNQARPNENKTPPNRAKELTKSRDMER